MTNRVHVLSVALVLGAGACDGGEKTDAKSVAKQPGDTKTRVYDGPGGNDGGGGPAINPQQLLDRIKPIMAALPKEAPNADNPTSDAKVELGRMLYFEKRLSIVPVGSPATLAPRRQVPLELQELRVNLRRPRSRSPRSLRLGDHLLRRGLTARDGDRHAGDTGTGRCSRQSSHRP